MLPTEVLTTTTLQEQEAQGTILLLQTLQIQEVQEVILLLPDQAHLADHTAHRLPEVLVADLAAEDPVAEVEDPAAVAAEEEANYYTIHSPVVTRGLKKTTRL